MVRMPVVMVWMATVAREMGATSAGADAAEGARSGDERPRRAIGKGNGVGAKPRKRAVRLQKRRRGQTKGNQSRKAS